MSAATPFESGARNSRTEYVRESTVGTAPTNPSWSRFSDVVTEFDPDHGANPASLRGLGNPDSQGVYSGTEEPSLTVTYYLQQKSASGNTFLDGSSNPNDAATDGLQRDSDNRIQNTHTVVDRITQSSIAAGNTWSGNTSRDTRQYWVCKGGYIDEVTITGDPEDPLPVQVEVTYEFEKVRHYQIDQPASAEEVWVESTDASDTSQTLTIENEDAGTTEDISLNGTTQVQSTNTFANIDAAHLDAETVGDVNVYVDDSAAAGDLLFTIYGQNSYDHGEGNLGVPALGTGSHASAISQNYELYHDDEVEQPDGTTVADNFGSTEFTVTNNVDGSNRGSTPRRSLSAGDREVAVSVTVWGETEVQTRVSENLRSATGNVRWTFEGGYLQADSADPRETDTSALSADESKLTTDIEFRGQGISVSA